MDEWSVTVRSVRRVGERTVALDLETPAGFRPKPGQFVLVRATIGGEEHARHYTMSSPDADGTFELTVGIDPEGTLSGWLAERAPGDRLRVDGPFGTIYYDGEPSIAVLAGGPGIGAGLGVAERAHREGHRAALIAHPEGEDGLVHGARFATLAAAGVPCYVCRAERTVAAAVGATIDDRPDAAWFVFGFMPFAELAKRAIAAGGGDPSAAAIENYGPG